MQRSVVIVYFSSVGATVVAAIVLTVPAVDIVVLVVMGVVEDVVDAECVVGAAVTRQDKSNPLQRRHTTCK